LNAEPILAGARKANGLILTVEDNFAGGFNSAIAEAAARAGDISVHAMTAPRVPKSGETDDIIAYLGLSVADIVRRAKALVR
jgi:transketolase C-terminal domain/subunit